MGAKTSEDRNSLIAAQFGPGRRSAAKLLTKDAAQRIAANIAKLPEAIAEALARRVVRRKAKEDWGR